MRHAERHADDEADGRQFERCGEKGEEVGEDRPRGGERDAEIAAQQLQHIFPELLPHRLVEPELEKYPLIDFRRRLLADDRQYRINRQDAADEEGEGGKADQRDGHGEEPRADVEEQLQRSGKGRVQEAAFSSSASV
jgi:hypothetical protein